MHLEACISEAEYPYFNCSVAMLSTKALLVPLEQKLCLQDPASPREGD